MGSRIIMPTACVALALLASGVARLLATTHQDPPPTIQDIHLATTVQRQELAQARAARGVALATNGLETNSAGFYVVRPSDDLQWNNTEDPTLSSGGFVWDSWRVRYLDVEYQRRCPAGIPQDFTVVDNAGWCLIAQSRMFINGLVTASSQVAENGQYVVTATFSVRSVNALKVLLANEYVNADGSFVDWFGATRSAGQAATAMKLVVASNGELFQPFVVQDIVASGPGPTTVVVARGLSQQEASQLAAWLNLP